MMDRSQPNYIQNPLASREKGYNGLYSIYNPTPSFPGNYKVRDEDEGRVDKIIWKLQPCGKSGCQICPLLNCGSVVKSNFTNRKFSILTNRDLD